MINSTPSLPLKQDKLQIRDDKLLQVFENIKKSIAEIDDIKELQGLRNMADGFEQAWQGYYRSSGFGFEQMFLGWETKVRSERKMGEMLRDMPKKENQYADDIMSLAELGISGKQSERYQQIANILDKKFDKIIEELRLQFKEPTTAELFKTAHVSHNSGENEWYTPLDIIELARKTMGSIDLDPASSEEANKIVNAKKYFTFKNNGLTKEWPGNVWMNPPFSMIPEFTSKLVDEYTKGNIKQACVISLNGTETQWCQHIMQNCKVVCFPKGRIKFLDKDRKPHDGSPLQGNIIFYFGNNPDKFEENFKELGTILWHKT
jgi:ParB family chromosome partitioning protein